MAQVSEVQLSELTGKTRATIRKRLADVPRTPGPHGARLYESKIALEAIFVGPTDGSGGKFVSNTEAQRQLTLARKEEIDLNMEVTRRERWRKEDVEEVWNEALTNAAGILKAHEDKLGAQLVQDIFTEFRGVGERLSKL